MKKAITAINFNAWQGITYYNTYDAQAVSSQSLIDC